MDLLSTKTPAERQDDEANRLVRPAPKYKPPRHDRRRERDNSDDEVDPDEAADRKDRSENYKTIGGSAGRVAARFVQGMEFPSQKALKQYLKDHPDSDPSSHTVVEDKAKGKGKPEEGDKGKGKAKPGEGKGKGKAKPPAAAKGPKAPTAPKRENYDSDEEYQASVDQHKQALQKFQGDLQAQAEAPRPKRKDFGSEEEFEAAIGEHKKQSEAAKAELAKLQGGGGKPTPKPPRPKRPEEVVDLTEEAEVVDEAPPPPPPPRPKATVAQRQRAVQKLLDTFPPDTAASLIRANLHPQDVDNLVQYYSAVASAPEKDIGAFAGRVGQFFETDPAKVQVPKQVRVDGQELPYESLTPEAQAEAYRAHQVRTVAISLAAQKVVEDSLAKALPKGVDEAVTKTLSSVMLKPPGEARTALSTQASEALYDRTAGRPMAYVPVEQARKLLASLEGNPDAQRVAVAYLQGNDFATAKTLFLHSSPSGWGTVKRMLGGAVSMAATPAKLIWSLLADSDDDDFRDSDKAVIDDDFMGFSERNSPRDIGKGVQAAKSFLQSRAKDYPQGLVEDRDPGEAFKRMVVQRIGVLAPEKAPPLRVYLEQQEIKDYDRDLKAYQQREAEWEMEADLHLPPAPKKPVRSKFKSAEEFQDAMRAFQGLLEDREAGLWAYAQKNPKPREPVKPDHYDRVANPKATKDLRKWLLSEQFSQYGSKTAAQVAARHVISSYSTIRLMPPESSRPGKAAVYHGVPPYQGGVPPQTSWQQPAQRDLGETDWDLILKSAKEWLKTPVLAMPMAGAIRDTQLRAALDLAIYQGPYNGAIQPNNYNMLLARLAGADEHQTLLTQRTDKVMKASHEIRKLAAKYAAENAPLAYDLMDLASKVAQDEGDGDDQGQDKQAQDQEQDQGGQDKQATLRSEVIKAAQGHPEHREAFMSVLRLIKAQDDQSQDEQGQKQAADKYAALRSATIQAASKAPEARQAFLPVLQTIKTLG